MRGRLLVAVILILWPVLPVAAAESDPLLFERAKQVGDAWLDDGVIWSRKALEALEEDISRESDPEQRRRRILWAARMARWLGDHEKADALINRSDAEAEADSPWGFVTSLERALAPLYQGDLAEARRRFVDVQARYPRARLPVVARIWFDVARAQIEAAGTRPEAAVQALADAALGIKQAPQPLRAALRALVLLRYGQVAASFLDLESVVRSYDEAFQLRAQLPGPPNVAEIVYHLGNLLNRSGQSEAARLLFSRLAAAGRAQNSPRSVFLAEYGLMKVWHNLGDPERSDAHGKAALATYTPGPLFFAALAQHRALNALSRQEITAAREWYERAAAVLGMAEGHFGEAEYQSYQALIAAELAVAEGREGDALDSMRAYARLRTEAVREIFQRNVAYVLSTLLNELEQVHAVSISEKLKAERHTRQVRLTRQIGLVLVLVFLGLLALFWWQRRIARRLTRARLAAEEASRSKDAFLANMSHELRTPLNAIIGFAEWAAREPYGRLRDPRYHDRFGEIAQSGRHLLGIINDLIQASAQNAFARRVEEAVAPVAEDIAAAVKMVADQARERGKRIVTHVEPELPLLRTDHRLVRQVLINLLSNAIKYASSSPEIRVYARRGQDGGLELVVEDDGPGMSAEELTQARTRFGRPVSWKGGDANREEGSGLGLAIVDDLVRAQNGEWTIDSAPGEGTRVSVRLPKGRLVPTAA